MSTVQDLASGLRAAAQRLPTDTVISAADRLTIATELLAWVRRSSPHPVGVPHLGTSIDHLENAVRSLRAAHDDIETYIAALGLAGLPIRNPTGEIIRRPEVPEERQPDQERRRETTAPLSRWWIARVDKVTELGDGSCSKSSHSTTRDPIELLREVATEVRDEDRSGLRNRLRDVDPPVGLGLSVVSAPALRRLTTDYLRRVPKPEDVRALTDLTGPRLRTLLPGLDRGIQTTLVERLCGVPPAQREKRDAQRRPGDSGQRPGGDLDWERVEHPADLAIANAVLVGILLRRLDRAPDSIGQELTSQVAEDAEDPTRPPTKKKTDRANAW